MYRRTYWLILIAFLFIFALLIAPFTHPLRAAPPQAVPAQSTHTVYLPLLAGQSAAPPPFSVAVDPAVQPEQPSLPDLGDGVPRPLAALAGPHNTNVSFVADELLLQTADRADLDALLARYGASLLLEITPADSGITDLPPLYLIRLPSGAGSAATLAADLATLAADRGEQAIGEHRISNDAGARTLGIAAAEARSGMAIGVNWVGATTAIPGSTSESAAGLTWRGTAYSRNAYDWTYFSRGSTQDIGVAAAWSLLAQSGRFGNRVPVAILDKGFVRTADTPTDLRTATVIPFMGDPIGVRGDGRSPWHGTHVLNTAIGRADNGSGAAGVAPMGEGIALYTGYDYVLSIAAVLQARSMGAKVINMSYSANVPAIVSWTVLPFEATTAAVRRSGVLLFASAGNDGRDVDGQDCFIVCWEHTWHTPCENNGVICVGGLGWDAQTRHTNSNFGTRGGVQIFAPFEVYAGADPDIPGGDTNLGIISGTSFSAPFAAGVAALIWAADPRLSAEQVWTMMRDTAHEPATRHVPRYVNAYGAVLRTIGSGVDVRITAPASGAVLQEGLPQRLTARIGYVADRPGVPLNVQWRTATGRILDNQTFTPGVGEHSVESGVTVSDLPRGEQRVTVRATVGPAVAEASVTFFIQNSPPVVTISNPAPGTAYCVGETIMLRGSATDINQPDGLPDSAYAWESARDGALGTGPVITPALSVGGHTITLRVTDAGGQTGVASVYLLVRGASDPECVNLPPSAQITAPPDGTSVYVNGEDAQGYYYTFTFVGQVSDPDNAVTELDVEWLTEDGSLGTVTPSASGEVRLTARLYVRPDEVGSGISRYTVTLRVTDGPNVREDTIRVTVQSLI
jgi:serine protease